MSYFDRIWAGLKSVIQLEADVARLTAKVEQLDGRERETRERLIYLKGVIAGARARAADQPRIGGTSYPPITDRAWLSRWASIAVVTVAPARARPTSPATRATRSALAASHASTPA